MSSPVARPEPAAAAAPSEFRPPFWLRGPHGQTVLPSLWPARPPGAASVRHEVPVSPRDAVLVVVDRPPAPRHGTLLLIHGMGGSAESGYMRRTTRQALLRGLTCTRMNLRNCGGTEALSRTLYNAGQSDDVGRVLEWLEGRSFPRPFLAAGFSLGGNILLRYVGLAGAESGIDRVATVNPPVDLARCAAAIELPGNRLYQRHYVRRLCRQIRRIRRARGLAGPPPRPREIRTVRRFDERYTAPDAGHASAADYYAAASAAPRLAGNRTPALVLSARDDPFVPVEMFAPLSGTPGLSFLHPARGGHCGYWQRGRPRYWAAEAVLAWLDPR